MPALFGCCTYPFGFAFPHVAVVGGARFEAGFAAVPAAHRFTDAVTGAQVERETLLAFKRHAAIRTRHHLQHNKYSCQPIRIVYTNIGG